MQSDVYFDPDVETMSRSDLRAMQEEQLLDRLPRYVDEAPLLRKTWSEAGVSARDIRSLDDFLERAPFISKDDIRSFRDTYGDPFGGTLAGPVGTTVLSTSGSTGDATLYSHRWADHHPYWAAQARDLWHIGVRPGDVVLGSSFAVRGQMFHAEQRCGATTLMVRTSSLSGWGRPLVDAIRRFRPVYGVLSGLSVAELEQTARDTDMVELLSSFKGVCFGGEPLSAGSRAKLESWGLEIFGFTQCGDVIGAIECRGHDGVHAWEDQVLVEALDPAGTAAVPQGQLGELVTTSLNALATPLVRFRSGDLVRMTADECSCGRTHVRFHTMGRTSDETVVHGRGFMPLDVSACLEAIPETSAAVYQIIRAGREVDQVEIHVGYAPAVTRSVTELVERVLDAFEQEIGIRPELRMLPEAELLATSRGGKLQRLVTI